MATTKTAAFVNVMRKMKKPGGKQPLFLQAHYDAPGRALTMTNLADAANYKAYNGANLRYGVLAERIGKRMGFVNPSITLLADLIEPPDVSNRHWILVLHPSFAAALKIVGWVT